MDESAAGNGRDGTASFDLESWWRTVLGWLLRNVCGEQGRIVIFSTLTEYVGGLEKNEQRVKTVSAGQQGMMMMQRLCSMRASS
jgi:hypothetical protein